MVLYSQERWTGGSIPTFFHWVLAGFLLVLGTYHWRRVSGEERVRTGSIFPVAALLAAAAFAPGREPHGHIPPPGLSWLIDRAAAYHGSQLAAWRRERCWSRPV
jgi:hypothetical protein